MPSTPGFTGALGTTDYIDLSESVSYTAGNPANWNPVPGPPTKVNEALDRLAAAVKALGGNP